MPTLLIVLTGIFAVNKEPAAPPTIKSFAAPYPSLTSGSIERLDPALDRIIAPDAKLEKVAEGFDWSEGPVWVSKGRGATTAAGTGFLLFSDIPPNTIYKWTEGIGVTVFMRPCGYHGDRTDMKEPGTNGLTLDKAGNLVMCQHGDRRLAKLASWSTPQGKQVVLADKYDGQRFNSPNDLAYHPSGDLFFTDPQYGLAKNVDDPGKELPFQGIFRLDTKGKVHLLYKDLERPNGLAFSPDGKTLYVANSHPPRAIWMAFDVKADKTLGEGRVLFDATELVKTRKGLPDGLKVDKTGNIFATGPGGVFVFSKQGKHLGTILTGEATANCAFGGDGGTLYITADMYLARIRLQTKGRVP